MSKSDTMMSISMPKQGAKHTLHSSQTVPASEMPKAIQEEEQKQSSPTSSSGLKKQKQQESGSSSQELLQEQTTAWNTDAVLSASESEVDLGSLEPLEDFDWA